MLFLVVCLTCLVQSSLLFCIQLTSVFVLSLVFLALLFKPSMNELSHLFPL